jgi:nicotinamidase-related amidase
MAKTALVLLDLQAGILSMLNPPPSYFALLAQTVSAARAAGIPLIYTTSALRGNFADASPNNAAVTRVKSLGPDVFVEGSAFTSLHADVPSPDPERGEAVVVKRRNSALANTDLEVLLRSLACDALVLAGAMTSGAVLSTVRQAADSDYRVTVLSDLCLDRDDEVQLVLMGKVFPAQGAVMDAGAWLDCIRG